MKFLSYDGWLMNGLRKLLEYVLLGLLWIVASIPVITFGASSVAMFYTAEKSIHKEQGKIFSTFWRSFRKEFVQASVLWLIAFALGALLGTSCYFAFLFKMSNVMKVILVAVTVLCVGWMQLWFGYLSKFEDRTRVLLKNTLWMTLMNIPRVAILIILAAAAVAGIAVSILTINPVWLLLITGIYSMASGCVLRKIFQKYIPEESEEQQETEDEISCE